MKKLLLMIAIVLAVFVAIPVSAQTEPTLTEANALQFANSLSLGDLPAVLAAIAFDRDGGVNRVVLFRALKDVFGSAMVYATGTYIRVSFTTAAATGNLSILLDTTHMREIAQLVLGNTALAQSVSNLLRP